MDLLSCQQITSEIQGLDDVSTAVQIRSKYYKRFSVGVPAQPDEIPEKKLG